MIVQLCTLTCYLEFKSLIWISLLDGFLVSIGVILTKQDEGLEDKPFDGDYLKEKHFHGHLIEWTLISYDSD